MGSICCALENNVGIIGDLKRIIGNLKRIIGCLLEYKRIAQ